jgi:hypothetical protein
MIDPTSPTPAVGAKTPAEDDELRLLPCPFCGGTATFRENEGGHYVECGECRAGTCMMFPEKCDVLPLLAERWNSRPAPISPAAGNTGDAGERLAEIAAREAKATPGPWVIGGCKDHPTGYNARAQNICLAVRGPSGERVPNLPANIAFNAHARADIPWLLSSLATSEAARETYRLQAEGAERERDAAKAEAAGLRFLVVSAKYHTRHERHCPSMRMEGPCDCGVSEWRRDAEAALAAPATLPHDSAPAGTSQGSDAGMPERSTGAEGTP